MVGSLTLRDIFSWDSRDDGDGKSPAPHDVVKNFNVSKGDTLDLFDILDPSRTVIAANDNGDLMLQVIKNGNAGKVYQEITIEGIAYGSSEADTILANLKDHGTSNDL